MITVYFSNAVLVPQASHVSLDVLDIIVVSSSAMLVFQEIHFLIAVFHMSAFLSNEELVRLQTP
jgi:hypothetical protein